MVGVHALGLPNHNNAIESSHRHFIRRKFDEVLGNAKASKYSLLFVLKTLQVTLLKESPQFELEPEVTTLDQKRLENDTNCLNCAQVFL